MADDGFAVGGRGLEFGHGGAVGQGEAVGQGPFECLVVTVLSAQTTDRRVNAVRPTLFSAYPDARAMAAAPTARTTRPRASIEQGLRNVAYALLSGADVYQCRHLVSWTTGERRRQFAQVIARGRARTVAPAERRAARRVSQVVQRRSVPAPAA